jgi:DNA polymerase I-like protein with 3'-5' exonuclease and polymerase domains
LSDIKECFPSRFGRKGFIVEFDYSQLEVIALAELSGDKQLAQDIRDGKDMHCISASFLYSEHYDIIKAAVDRGDIVWTKRRKIAKGPGFLLQYGGGAKLMAKNTGLRVEDCQAFIDNYYTRYPDVKKFQDDNIEAVTASRELVQRDANSGMVGRGTLVGPTGRRYTFWERPSPEWKIKSGGTATSFPPTNIKNYPVQGFATGDIVPEMLGRVMDALLRCKDKIPLDKCLMINTVHDSILFDIHEEVLEDAIDIISFNMAQVGLAVKERWDIDLTLPFKVGVDVGTTWGDKQPLDTLLND